jgi:glycosyltransferase involved in cell wall biosynthesis
MPIGERYGWGICGKYLLKELSEIADIRYIKDKNFERGMFDPIFKRFVDSLEHGYPENGNAPILQCISDINFEMGCNLGNPNVGYTFFELTNLKPEHIENAKKFDILVAGSTWCKEVLEGFGVPSRTIIQGVDKELFHPRPKQLFRDKFVVYSGGKFEYRKGQDIVLAAFKVLQDRHDDVMLICNWYNLWPSSMLTMENSHYIQYGFNPNQGFEDSMIELILRTGINPDRVVLDIPRPHPTMPYVYQNTDVGLFPNRCEGGTNLVFMEYMAMGKPAIASYSTGHKDLTGYKRIECPRERTIMFETGPQLWPEPDLEQTIELLEVAYQNGTLKYLPPKMPTWTDVAQEFYALVS